MDDIEDIRRQEGITIHNHLLGIERISINLSCHRG